MFKKTSDDEEDQGIRRSGRARKTVDYTFKEFEEDITSAVENDKKRFKTEEVNGEEKELLYSKPAYETGRLLVTGGRNTRRSRRLMDLDYESDSESRTSGYEYEGNFDEEGQRASTWHGNLRRQRRVIDDDDDDDGNVEVENNNANEAKVSQTEQGEASKDGKEENVKDELTGPSESAKSQENSWNGGATANKADDQESKTDDDNKDDKNVKAASSGSESQVGVAAVFATSQSQNTALPGNKIHPHSRIASVAPVARNQPVTTDTNQFVSPTGYPPEGVFPNPPNFDIFKPQFPAKQTPNYLGSNFAGVNLATTNITGNNFTGTASLPPSSASGMLQGGSSFPGAQGVGVPNARTNFGGPGLTAPGQRAPNFSSSNLNFPNTNLAGQNMSGTNFRGSFTTGGLNNLGPSVGGNIGTAANFVGSNTSANSLAGLGTMKNPTQTMSGSFWGGQSEINSVYNYQGFPQSTGTTPAPVSSPTNNQALPPPPYPPASQLAESSQYAGYNQQFQATSNMQNNYVAPQQSGNFPNSSFFATTPRQPPPPYSANASQNANLYANNSQESRNLAGNQWTYPEAYGYYPGQGNAAGQSF